MSWLDDFTVDPGATFDFSSPTDLPTPDFSSLPTNWTNIFSSDTGGIFPSGPPIVGPPLNLPTSGKTGLTGLLDDITSLVSSVYAGEAKVANARAGYQMTEAQNALQLRNVKSLPSLGTMLAFGGAALLAIVLVEKSAK